MSPEEVKILLERAADNLFEHQPDIFDFTDDSSQTEWNITQHFASEVHALLPDYDYDVDLKKPGVKNKRPDIVFHRRRTHESNFLVVEMKRRGSDIPKEINKIETLWFKDPLKYQYGAVVVINELNSCQIVVLENRNR